MITRIFIEHFKSIENLDISFGPLTVLVGPNGVGKSNIIDALEFVRDAVRNGLDRAVSERHGIDSIRQWTHKGAFNVSVTTYAESYSYECQFSFTLGSNRGDYTVKREYASIKPCVDPPFFNKSGKLVDFDFKLQPYTHSRDGTGAITIEDGEHEERSMRATEERSMRATEERSMRATEERSMRATEKRSIRATDEDLYVASGRHFETMVIREMIANFEAFSIFPNTLRMPQNPSNDKTFSSSGDNLTSIFKLMQKTRSGQAAKSNILTALQHIMPSLESISVHSVAGLMALKFRVRESGGKLHDFNVSQISDGTLRVLGLLTALYQPNKPAVIALEEPEQTIHPGALAVIADAIKEAAQETQIIVTTHSPEFVDHFEPNDIRAVEMVDGVTQIGEISRAQKEAVKERLFSLGELMAREGLHAE